MPRKPDDTVSVADQARAGSGAAQAVQAECDLVVDYAANVLDRMRTAVVYGVDDATSPTGLRNLPEDKAGALLGVLRTMQSLLVPVDDQVAAIVGKPPVHTTRPDDWEVTC